MEENPEVLSPALSQATRRALPLGQNMPAQLLHLSNEHHRPSTLLETKASVGWRTMEGITGHAYGSAFYSTKRPSTVGGNSLRIRECGSAHLTFMVAGRLESSTDHGLCSLVISSRTRGLCGLGVGDLNSLSLKSSFVNWRQLYLV